MSLNYNYAGSLLDVLIHQSRDMVAVIDTSLNYLYLNESLSAALKRIFSLEYKVGDYVFKNVNQANVDYLKPYLEAGLKNEEAIFEYSYWIGQQEYCTEIAVIPLKPEHEGKASEIGIIARDITERIKQKRELEKAHRSVKLAHEVTRLGSWRWDLKSNVLFIDLEKQRILEFENPDDKGIQLDASAFVSQYVYSEDQQYFIEQVRSLTSDQEPVGSRRKFEYRLKEVNGMRKILEITAIKETPSSIYGITQDITHYRKTEKEILKTRNQLQSIIENTNDSIWLLDNKLTLILFNRAYKTVFDELNINIELNQSLNERFGSETQLGPASKWQKRYEDVLKGQTVEFEETISHKDQVQYFEGTLNPVIEKNKIVGIAGISRNVTERKKAAIEVIKREQQLNSIIENTNDSIWLVDQNGVMVLFNSSAKETLARLFSVHFEQHTTLEQRLMGKLPEDYIKLWRERYAYAVKGNRYKFIERLDTSKGILYYEITLNPVIENEKITGVSVYAHNITDSKLHQEQLELNNQLLHAVIESPTKTIIFSLDEQYRYTAFNNNHRQTMKAIWGCDIEVGHNMLDYIKYDSDREKAKINFDRALSGESFNQIEEYGEHPNRFFYEDAYNPIFNNKSEVTGLTVFLFDITKTKLNELALSESENRLNYVLDATGEGVWDWNIKTRDLYCNQAWLQLLEFDQNDYNAKIDNYLECIFENDRMYIAREIIKCISGEVSRFNLEHRLRTKKNNVIWVLNRGKVVEFDKNNKPSRMVGSLINITERKKDEEEKMRLLHELSGRNRDLEQFTYIISHNLRAPVAKILGIVELIKEEYDTENLKQLIVDMLSKESKEIDLIIKDLNDIISVRNTKNEAFEVVNLDMIFQRVASVFESDIAQSSVQLKVNFSKANNAFGISTYIQSIFYNLLSNALKYANPEKQLSITVESFPIDDRFLIIQFSDNGLGINLDENSEKIFGLYQRFHHHTPGKGLGLFITKTQAEIMGGKIMVKSQPGIGSTFHLQLLAEPRSL